MVLLFFVVFLFFAASAEAGVATLYKGNVALGEVPATDDGGYVVSVVDAGALLGLEASLAGEELLLTRGGNRLRIIPEAVAAWYNSQLVPLYGPGRFRNGRWWMDVPSLLSLLQRFAGRSASDRLRLDAVQAKKAVQEAPPVREPPAIARNPVTPEPEKKIAENKSAENKNTENKNTENKSAENKSAEKKIPEKKVAEKKVAENVAVTPVSAPKTPEKKPTPQPSPVASPASASGEIRAVRWSTSREKVRAVIDCSDESNPEIKVAGNKISMNFARIVDGLAGIPAPYENVDAALVQGTKFVTITFTAFNARVEKFILNAPRRVVLDFIFTSPAVIKEAPPPPAKQPATPVAPVRREGPKKNGKLLVVLDPGHGGRDPGAVGNGFREKDITLGIGLQMEKALKARGMDVRMTRRTDVYLTLQERTDIANKVNADMFVSIHVNSLPPGKNSAGFEIYLMALPTDKDALALAKIENREYLEDRNTNGAASDRRTELLLKILGDMQQNNKITESTTAAEVLFKAGNAANLPMKRVAQAPFFVLRGAGMPAVLMETGFITNAREAKLLAHPGYQQKIAEAMANGINAYLK
ncbi:MAG: N-acetylmuramoyl-L-alanine amidase [Synergistaceae bacterium]|nr:N-acetylmuramoyl-L-alanine amidase [Synergistaceae bacterium]